MHGRSCCFPGIDQVAQQRLIQHPRGAYIHSTSTSQLSRSGGKPRAPGDTADRVDSHRVARTWVCPTAVVGAQMKALKKGILKRVSNDDVHSQQPPAPSVNGGDVFYDAPEVRTAPCKIRAVFRAQLDPCGFRMRCWRRPLQHDRSSLHSCILGANSSGPC